jgi:hypothetical protein
VISDKQNRFYWRLWSQAKKQLMHGRETFTADEENKRRHELHIRALGRDKSHLDFTNRELDYVLAQFRTIITPYGSRITDHRSHSTVAEAHRRRLYFGLRGTMRRMKLSEDYVNAIARSMFLGLEINDLAVDELQKLIIALKQHERRNAA